MFQSLNKNKRGWIKIVEAFVAVLMISGVLLYVVDASYLTRDRSALAYDVEISILREIQLNESLREDVLGASAPVESSQMGFPESIQTRVEERAPSYLQCKTKICPTSDTCTLSIDPTDEEVYAQSTIIAVTLKNGYDPRRLKLFCWIKE